MRDTSYRHCESIRDHNTKVALRDWGRRHCLAFRSPRPNEQGIISLINSTADYADRHVSIYGTRIGDDSVLGKPWAEIVRNGRRLLDGDQGRLDCGTLDAMLCDMLNAEGFEP